MNEETKSASVAGSSIPPPNTTTPVNDGNAALLLVSARLRYVAGKTWGAKRYHDMPRLRTASAAPVSA